LRQAENGAVNGVKWNVVDAVAAMRIQVTEAMFDALTTAHFGYQLKQRGEVEVKVRRIMRF